MKKKLLCLSLLISSIYASAQSSGDYANFKFKVKTEGSSISSPTNHNVYYAGKMSSTGTIPSTSSTLQDYNGL